MNDRPILVLSASQRAGSNSAAIGRYLAERLAAAGVPVSCLDAREAGFARGDTAPLVEALAGCRQVVFVASVYHDTLNWLATAVLEAVAGRVAAGALPAGLAFTAVAHSGCPEPAHARVALAVCRRFAAAAGWTWLGGLSAGATSPIGGQPLAALGWMTRRLRAGLDLAAADLAAGRPPGAAAVRAAARPPMPAWLFVAAGNLLMRREAGKKGCRDMGVRPYARPEKNA